MSPRPTEQSYRARVARVVAAIVADPTAEHRLEDLAALAHFSPFHFHRVYAGVVGETVNATIRRVRLARAANLLAEGRESVTQVGQAVGYDSPQAFSRAFGQFAGQSPRAFQQQLNPPGPDGVAAPVPADEIRVVEHPARQVFGLRHGGPPSTIAHAHWRMRQLLGGRPVSDWLGLSIGDPDEEAGFAYYVAVVAAEALPESAELEPIDIPAGMYALHELVGPYTRINATLNTLYARWMPGSGYEPDQRPAVERYLDSPRHTDSADLRTELLVPIRSATRS
jgi:AraC family transcriptional regulator